MANKKTANTKEEVKTIEQLQSELTAKHNDLLEAKKGHAAGELANPHILKTIRKDIARLKTAIRTSEIEQKESK